MSSRTRWIAALISLAAWSLCHAQPAAFYISTQGNDAWSGKLDASNAAKTDGPFATLERARDEIRKLKKAGGLPKGGVTVELRGGIYERDKTFELTKDDSGAPDAPIVYRAHKGEVVRLVGGKVVRGWKPVSDPAVLNRLNGPACSAVLQADLRAQGITDLGIPAIQDRRKEKPGRRLELFFQDKPMTLARWPNTGFVKIVKMVGKPTAISRGRTTYKVGKFTYDGDRPKRWIGEKDVWLHGYWYHDWSDQRERVQSIDTKQRIIALAPPYHHYGYRAGHWYYAFNLLSEIDEPGEWYLDRDEGILYFWPPAPITQGKAIVSVARTLVQMENASHVTLRGLLLEAMRATAIVIRRGTDDHVVGCTIRNGGENAVTIAGGTKSGVYGCDIYDMGGSGINLNGGDRKTLTPAGLYAENNHIHHYARWYRMYKKAVALGGVGNIARHNLIHDAPHQAMGFWGNDHLIEFNEIHSVCYESNDAGAIYAGRNWTMRGTIIRYNYFHDICGFEGRGCVGVYLDDMFCGTLVQGNLFYNVTRAAMVGGGRDCIIDNNVFVDCRPSVHVDARALGWAHACADRWIEEAKAKGTLQGIRYKEPPYSTRYPKLPPILDENPKAPCGNVVSHNIIISDRWNSIRGKAKPLVKMENNLINEDPHFVNAAKLDFRLKPDSPAFKLGFKPIPIDKMGLYKDDRRASWPVSHKVRPMPKRPTSPRYKRTGKRPTFNVPRLAAAVQIDGNITPAEWFGKDVKKGIVIQEGIRAETLKPSSVAWIARDDKALYVAVLNEVDPSLPLRMGATWGSDDAVEIALRNPAAGKKASIFILRGYPNGTLQSSDEAGAPFEAVNDAREATTYAAKVIDKTHWAAEFRIGFAGIGVNPAKHHKLAFNISVRKTAKPMWEMWCGTFACTWEVDNAGTIVLGK